VVLQSKIDDVSKEEFKKVMDKLSAGLNVQESSANLMEFLVQDLLDYAQLKAGKFRKNINKFNVEEAIEQVCCIQRHKAQKQGIELITEFPNISNNNSKQSHFPNIISDVKRIQQIVLNLVSNALKFTETGSVKVRSEIFDDKVLTEDGKIEKI